MFVTVLFCDVLYNYNMLYIDLYTTVVCLFLVGDLIPEEDFFFFFKEAFLK